MDVRAFNRTAWNREVGSKNMWTIPVSSEEILRAQQGDWSLLLTPIIPVPRNWFPEQVIGLKVLCLASGGGQQGPILAAAGCDVTVFDNSPKQLAQDNEVAEREGLRIRTVEGDMIDLAAFANESFDLIFHPCSNCFSETIRPVWTEAFRVLRPGGHLLAGFCNPLRYLFDEKLYDGGELSVRHQIPYSDVSSIDEEERNHFAAQRPMEFGHTLDDQIAGQLDAGFVLTGFYEDSFDDSDLLSRYLATFIATRAAKL